MSGGFLDEHLLQQTRCMQPGSTRVSIECWKSKGCAWEQPQVTHPCCIKLHAVYVTQRRVYIVTEVVTGGELLDRYKAQQFLPPLADRHFDNPSICAMRLILLTVIYY